MYKGSHRERRLNEYGGPERIKRARKREITGKRKKRRRNSRQRSIIYKSADGEEKRRGSVVEAG